MTWKSWLIKAAGCTLIAAGAAKVISSMGSARILLENDPIFGMPTRSMMSTVGMLELFLGVYLLRGVNYRLQASVILWLGFIFSTYRVGLWWIGYKKPCTCLGSIAEKIGLSDAAADSFMKVVLAYFIIAGAAIFLSSLKARNSPSDRAITVT